MLISLPIDKRKNSRNANHQHVLRDRNYLYFFDNERHKLPHIHASYQGQEASFSIGDGTVLSGEIPRSKTRLVQAWIEIHRDALFADWALAVNGEPPFQIDPLR